MSRHDAEALLSPPEHYRQTVPSSGEFSTFRIDEDPSLLQSCYRLRYQVYCVERAFLPAGNYSDGVEVDEYDRYAWHFATIDCMGRVVATARLVLPSILGLPLFRHCTIFADEVELYQARHSVVEVSRLSMSRLIRTAAPDEPNGASHPADLRQHRDAVVWSLYRGLYQESKRAGITHWLVATEASLQRALRRFGFPFRAVGPEIDYCGPVTPYLMDLSVFDRVVLGGSNPRLNGFLNGLERRYHPAPVNVTRE